MHVSRLKFDKYAARYLADFQYRFNRRHNLRSILLRLLRAAATTVPWPKRRLTLGHNQVDSCTVWPALAEG